MRPSTKPIERLLQAHALAVGNRRSRPRAAMDSTYVVSTSSPSRMHREVLGEAVAIEIVGQHRHQPHSICARSCRADGGRSALLEAGVRIAAMYSRTPASSPASFACTCTLTPPRPGNRIGRDAAPAIDCGCVSCSDRRLKRALRNGRHHLLRDFQRVGRRGPSDRDRRTLTSQARLVAVCGTATSQKSSRAWPGASSALMRRQRLHTAHLARARDSPTPSAQRLAARVAHRERRAERVALRAPAAAARTAP